MDNLAAFLAGLGVAYIVFLVLSFHRRLQDIEARGAKRHTHNTLDGIGDAQALLVHQVLLGEMEKQRNLAMVKQVLRILGQTSEGPYSYQDCPGRRDQIIKEAVQDFIKSLNEEWES
jgi:hypothetical protein